MKPLWRSVYLLLLMIQSSLLSQQVIAANASDATATQATAPVSLQGRWSYHWGDPWSYHWGDLWAATQSLAALNWHTTAAPENIPGRNGQSTLWLRLEVPTGSWRDPYLLVSSVDLSIQVFDQQNASMNSQLPVPARLLYQFGEFDAAGRSRFAGWPWHMIRVPRDTLGQTLYFRVFSDYTDIGLSGEVLLGERAELLQRVYTRGFTGLTFAIVVFIVGFISMCLGLIKRERGVALATGCLSFVLALMMFAENELSQVVLFAPLLWRQLAAYSYFLVPALLGWVVLQWFRVSPPRIVKVVIGTSLSFVAGVLLLSLITDFNFVSAYTVFDGLFVVLVLALLVGSINHIRQVGLEGMLVVLGILTVFVSLLIDMASANGLIQWIGRAGQWGLAFFALSSLAIYLVRDWKQQHELNRLKHSLELEVAERTRELTASQRLLQQQAGEDYLTGLLNRRAFMTLATQLIAHAHSQHRPFSLLLFDVDNFKTINDRYGHALGDEVLKLIAQTAREHSRDSDLVCRYGGEEFVMLLQDTDAEVAESVAQRLRTAIAGLAIEIGEVLPLVVSVSIGVVALRNIQHESRTAEKILDEVLTHADAAMYRVKQSGRNGIQMLHELVVDDAFVLAELQRVAH